MRKAPPPEKQKLAIDRDLADLLKTIEQEEVPERLIDLARQLQAALRAQAEARKP